MACLSVCWLFGGTTSTPTVSEMRLYSTDSVVIFFIFLSGLFFFLRGGQDRKWKKGLKKEEEAGKERKKEKEAKIVTVDRRLFEFIQTEQKSWLGDTRRACSLVMIWEPWSDIKPSKARSWWRYFLPSYHNSLLLSSSSSSSFRLLLLLPGFLKNAEFTSTKLSVCVYHMSVVLQRGRTSFSPSQASC